MGLHSADFLTPSLFLAVHLMEHLTYLYYLLPADNKQTKRTVNYIDISADVSDGAIDNKVSFHSRNQAKVDKIGIYSKCLKHRIHRT